MKKSFAMMLTAALTTTSVCGFAFADEAANDPYGKYDELVTYTTGYSLTNQGADVLAGTPYENDTPENNAYTRYLKELLNIQNENDFEATMGDDYNQKAGSCNCKPESAGYHSCSRLFNTGRAC